MTSIATEHAGEAAHTLRQASLIDDPYMRADAVWEAVVRVQQAAARLSGDAAAGCAAIAARLEEGCEAGGDTPTAGALRAYARRLDAI